MQHMMPHTVRRNAAGRSVSAMERERLSQELKDCRRQLELLKTRHADMLTEVQAHRERSYLVVDSMRRLKDSYLLEGEGDANGQAKTAAAAAAAASAAQPPPSYYLLENPLGVQGTLPRAKEPMADAQRLELIAAATEEASQMCSRLEVLSAKQATEPLPAHFLEKQSLADECASLRGLLQQERAATTQADCELRHVTNKLRSVQVRWATAAMAYDLRPLTRSLPSLKAEAPLKWDQGQPSQPARSATRVAVVDLGGAGSGAPSDASPPRAPATPAPRRPPDPPKNLRRIKGRAPAGLRTAGTIPSAPAASAAAAAAPASVPASAGASAAPAQAGGDVGAGGLAPVVAGLADEKLTADDHAGCAIQGFRLLLSAFCTDVALLLHRFSEARHHRTREGYALLSAPPYFVRDKVSHSLLVRPSFRNPFADEIPMLHELYTTLVSSLLPLASPRDDANDAPPEPGGGTPCLFPDADAGRSKAGKGQKGANRTTLAR